MLASIWYIILMFVSYTFKKIGMELYIKENKNVIFYIILSKIIWWSSLIMLLIVWVDPKYLNYVLYSIPVLFSIKLFKERKYFVKKRTIKKEV